MLDFFVDGVKRLSKYIFYVHNSGIKRKEMKNDLLWGEKVWSGKNVEKQTYSFSSSLIRFKLASDLEDLF